MSRFVEQEIHKRNRWVYFSNYRWMAHVAYWTWVLIIGTLSSPNAPLTAGYIFRHFVLANLHIAAFFYLYCLFLIPYFFKRGKYHTFWLLLLLSLALIPWLDIHFNQLLNKFTKKTALMPNSGFWINYLYVVLGYIGNFLMFSVLLFFMEKNEESGLIAELEQEKREIEQVKLDLLKTNISPDFMMRSLNQLKRAALVPEPYTPESIIKFSELLRYRLYRSKQLQSPLTEELQALRDFISFIGFDHQSNHLSVELQVLGDPENKMIAALALINLLEPFCKTIPEISAKLKLMIRIEADVLSIDIIYNQKVTDNLFTDLEKYGADYIQLYGDAVYFNFENCEDETCRIEMILPLIKR